MSTKPFLTLEEERYIKTSLASERIGTEVIAKTTSPGYITDTSTGGTPTVVEISPATHPANSIVRITGAGNHSYDIEYINDTYDVGDEITFISVSGGTMAATGSDTGGTGEAPTVNGITSGGTVGNVRTLRKVRDYVTANGGLDATADQLLTSITTDVTGATASTTTAGVALVTATGLGSGGIVTVTTNAGGDAITAIDVTTAGINYADGDELTIAVDALGVGSTEVEITLVADDLAGTVQAEWDFIVG
jgi:hypothetical protein